MRTISCMVSPSSPLPRARGLTATTTNVQNSSRSVHRCGQASRAVAEDGSSRQDSCESRSSMSWVRRFSEGYGLTSVCQFPNAENVDFSDLEDRKPAQEFTVPQGREVGEYHVLYVTTSETVRISSYPSFTGRPSSQT